MSATMKLTAEGCAAAFDPADGGRLSSFRVGDHELLLTHGKDVFHWGSFVMAPWVGRLRDARLKKLPNMSHFHCGLRLVLFLRRESLRTMSNLT